jgi:hypothetical protein
MNLRGMANALIQSVNPNIVAGWIRSSGGYTTDAAGHRAANTEAETVTIQVQGLSAPDMAHTDGLNIQGVKRSVTMYGNVQGVVRADQKGGDILTFPEVPGGDVKSWRVVAVMETWPEWSKVVVVLQ